MSNAKDVTISRRPMVRLDVFGVLGWTLGIAVLLLIIYPLIMTLVREFTSDGAIDVSPLTKVLSDDGFYVALRNSGIVLAFAGTAALLIGSVFAWLNERTDASFGLVSRILPLVPLLIPPIALSIGWVFLAQERAGFLNGILRSLTALVGVHVETGPINIGTWPGMLFVYTMALVPYAYLVVSGALRNMDPALEEASRMTGAGPWKTVMKVSLPAIWPGLASAALLVVIVGISFFSIPRTIGSVARIETVSVYLVNLTLSFPSRLDEAVAVSIILLVFVGAVWWWQRRVAMRGRHVTIAGKAGAPTIVKLGAWRWVARVFMVLYMLCVSVLPFLALVVVAMQPFWQPVIDPSKFTVQNIDTFFFVPNSLPRDGLMNSLLLGLVGATLTIVIAAAIIIFARERRGRTAQFMEGTLKAPGAISNLVIGVAILVALGGMPWNLRGTLVILLLGYLVVAMPQASIAAEVARGQVGDQLIEASSVLGGSRFRTARSIILPLMRPGLIAGWALVFIVIVGDLTISAILSSASNLVVGSVFLQVWETGSFGVLAALGVSVCVLTGTIVALVLAISSRRRVQPGRVKEVPDVAAPVA